MPSVDVDYGSYENRIESRAVGGVMTENQFNHKGTKTQRKHREMQDSA